MCTDSDDSIGADAACEQSLQWFFCPDGQEKYKKSRQHTPGTDLSHFSIHIHSTRPAALLDQDILTMVLGPCAAFKVILQYPIRLFVKDRPAAHQL